MGIVGTNFFTKYGTTIEVALTDTTGNAVLIRCLAGDLPTGAGYAIGCVAQATDSGVGYMNTGTAAAATFTAFNSASALTVPSAFTDSTTTTGDGLAITASAITTGDALAVINGNTTNFTTGASLAHLDLGAAVAGNGLWVETSAAYTGTGLAKLVAGAMTTGVLLQLTSTTGLTSGSLLRGTTSTAGAVATNGIFSLRATGAYTSTSNAGLLDVAASATTAGTVVNIQAAALTTGVALNIGGAAAYTGTGMVAITPTGLTTGVAMLFTMAAATTGKAISIALSGGSQTATTGLSIVQTTTTTGYTGSLAAITSSSTTGTGSALLITMVNTTAGDGIKIVSNALTLGAGTGINVSHTTSVLGAGTSLVRISSTGVDTGTTTGTLLDLSQSAAVSNVAVLLTDSSADATARWGIKVNVTNAAAVGVVPFLSSSVAVTGTGSKFVKGMGFYNGTKTNYIWTSIDATTPNGALTATAGDICLNGPSSVPMYCTGTNVWVALA